MMIELIGDLSFKYRVKQVTLNKMTKKRKLLWDRDIFLSIDCAAAAVSAVYIHTQLDAETPKQIDCAVFFLFFFCCVLTIYMCVLNIIL